jgi:CheY-like chemotaxis protein
MFQPDQPQRRPMSATRAPSASQSTLLAGVVVERRPIRRGCPRRSQRHGRSRHERGGGVRDGSGCRHRARALVQVVPLLETDGHEVRAAEDRVRGAREATDWLPDVVLCDPGLPVPMDGYDVAPVLRRSARTAHLRRVALSGYADAAAVRQSKAAGFEVHLAKPVERATAAGVARVSGHGVMQVGRARLSSPPRRPWPAPARAA